MQIRTAVSMSDELIDDFKILEYIVDSALHRLYDFWKKTNEISKTLRPDTLSETEENISNLINTYKKIKLQIQNAPIRKRPDKELIETKKSIFESLRIYQNILGSVITSLDWQSPSFRYTIYPQSGRHFGDIIENINDYKRDGRLDNEDYESLFKKEFIDSKIKFPIRAFTVSSGMAAFTTILNFLIGEKILKNTALMGRSCYFENKQVLKQIIPEKIIEVDDRNMKNILKVIEKTSPDVLFFDSLGNVKDITIPDLPLLINFLKNKYRKKITLVIDNTGMSVYFQPYKYISPYGNIRIITFESLNKYYQFGMDRIIGGIITVSGQNRGKIMDYREHLGTTIVDSSLYALPIPRRYIIEKYLLRLSRNAKYLSESLDGYIKSGQTSPIKGIIYPMLLNHPAYQRLRKQPFGGTYFVFDFIEKYRKISLYKEFIGIVFDEAKKRKTDIIGGTSFGLPVTRIYLTSTRTDYGEPFVRVSLGNETLNEVEKLKETFISSIDRFSRFSLRRLAKSHF